ncbi:hypothetical protein ACJZ2D_002921 [Fusarium nematophilum]
MKGSLISWALLGVGGTLADGGPLAERKIAHPFADFASDYLSRRQNPTVPLRILPLGASTVFGVGSSTGNGFRKPLRDALRFDGWEVNMVGTKKNGDMADADNEAESGAVVDGVRENLQNSLPYKPNLVVINAGTNDGRNNDLNDEVVNKTGERMEALLGDIWAADDMAETCVLLSTLLATDGEKDANRKNINQQYRDLAVKLYTSGKCIFVADMDPPNMDPPWIPDDLIPDGIHPNDEGFKKMAAVFYKAFNLASTRLRAPPEVKEIGLKGCDKKPGGGKPAGGLTQQGSGLDDGIYYHNSEEKGIILSFESEWDRNQYRFARLYGRQYDDLVGWYERDGKHTFGVWKNQGEGKFDKISDMNPDIYCIPRGLHFIDINGDGYDDIVCISPEGDAHLSVNQKDGSGSNPPSFKYHGLIKDNEGYAQDRVRLADIDGDGRADYCILDDSGNVHCWRNGGVKEFPEFWQKLGLRFTAKGMGDMRGVRFEDINGDGRDDWFWVDDVGQTTTWTNARSCQKGKEGDGLNVAWRQGFYKDKTSGPTHAGMVQFGDSGFRNRVHFARIYGEPMDFGLLGRQDYVFLQHTELSSGKHKFDMRVWKNTGMGGTKLKADGNKYCNMYGHEDGREDYVWTHSKGEMRVYRNDGKTDVSGGQSFWGENEIIWEPRSWTGKDLDRRDLHLTDWDGDGACDIVWTDPDNKNRVSVWLNLYPHNGKWDWTYHASPASAENLECDQKRGLGIQDIPVAFADIDGNGRGDYLCISPSGLTTAHLHSDDNTWESLGQVKFPEGADRANIRWADVNGDSLADMLWVDKFTGNAKVYYNRGRGDPAELGGSSIRWDRAQEAYEGSYAGTCQYFPDLDGNGRADLHSVTGTFENKAESWFSPSCGLEDHEGDGRGGVVDPELPTSP